MVLVQIAWVSAHWMHYHACMTAATHMFSSTLGRVTVTINTAKLQLCVLKQSSRSMYTKDKLDEDTLIDTLVLETSLELLSKLWYR